MITKDDIAGGLSVVPEYLYEKQDICFSFNSLDFNSSHGFFTENDDDDDDDEYNNIEDHDDNDDDDDDDEGYIEITLNPPTKIHEGDHENWSTANGCSTTTNKDSSSSPPVMAVPCRPGADDVIYALNSSNSSTASSYDGVVSSSGGSHGMKRSNGGRWLPFRAAIHLINVFTSINNNVNEPPISSSSTTMDGNSNGNPQPPSTTKARWKLLRTRERRWEVTSSATTSNSIGSVGNKLLVKLRSNSIWLMLSSSLSKLKSRPSRVSMSPPTPTFPVPCRRYRTTSDALGSIDNGEKSKSLFLEIKLDAFSGVLEAITRNITVAAKRPVKQQAKSCPGSIKSSPLAHQQGGDTHLHRRGAKIIYARDNSIQAAIAHCKRSFGQPNDSIF